MIKLRTLPPVTIVIGLPRTGKTTCAAALVRQALRKKIEVFSNVPLLGAYKIDMHEELGSFAIPEGSLVICDESGLEFDNRDFDKTFKGPKGKALLTWLKLIGHYKCKLVMFSQTVDIDLKFRSMAGLMYLCRRSIIPGFSVFHRVVRRIDVSEDGKTLCDQLTLPSPFFRLFSARLFRPMYYKYFDSYDAPILPAKEWEPWQSVNA